MNSTRDASVESPVNYTPDADVDFGDSVQPLLTTDTITLIDSSNVAPAEKLQEPGYAYGKIRFGMHPDQVKSANAAKQNLAGYHYYFSYKYNENRELYAVVLHSDTEKAIYYETRLQDKYSNLCRIIAEKYGQKNKCGILPSIFDVMNRRTMTVVNWQTGEKKIRLGVQQVQLDAYRVVCEIIHPAMEEAAKKEKYIRENKKWIDASRKF